MEVHPKKNWFHAPDSFQPVCIVYIMYNVGDVLSFNFMHSNDMYPFRCDTTLKSIPHFIFEIRYLTRD